MVEIEISNNQEEVEVSDALLKELSELAVRTCALLNIDQKTISIALIDKAGIAELNQQYRGKDKPTDVLSFPLTEVNSSEPILGEIIIAVAVALEQAQEYGNNLQREMSFLLVHGILHLAGYDHDESHRGPMREKEKELAELLGLGQSGLNSEDS